MPELPEVETIARALKTQVEGAKIEKIIVRNAKFRESVPSDIAEKLCGAEILSVQRIAKYIVMDLSNGKSIIWHLGMSGAINVSEKVPSNPAKHDHIFVMTDKCCLTFNDPRRFGLFTYDNTANLSQNRFLKKCGVDPFSSELNAQYLFKKLQKKKSAVKLCLLEQDIINGIGNIYASEILFDCGISPERAGNNISLKECESIIKSTRKILQKSIDAGGSTLKDYHHLDGEIGHFQEMHCVYGKEGKKCPNCICDIAKTGGISKIVQGGRSTFYCKTKQK